MIIFGVLLVFIYQLIIDPLLQNASKMGQPLNMMEPYLAVGNSAFLVMLIPAVYLVLLSDYPKMRDGMMNMITRCGKTNWFLGQLLFIVCSIISIISAIFVFCMAFSKGVMSNDWSETVRKYIAEFPEERYSFAVNLLPSNLYNQMDVEYAVLNTTVFLFSGMLVLALILFLFKLYHLDAIGLLLGVSISGAGVVSFMLGSKIMWIWPTANALVWRHFDIILAARKAPVWRSHVYFGTLIVLLLCINSHAMKKMQFINIE